MATTRRHHGHSGGARRPSPSPLYLLAHWRGLRQAERIALGTALAATAWLGWQILAYGMADASADANPDRALRWRPDSAHALLVAAERQAAEASVPEELAAARQSALRAIGAKPLEIRAISVLGFLSQRLGEEERAGQILEIAGGRNLRHWPTQAALINRGMAKGDFAGALRRTDALLRAYSGEGKQILPLLLASADNSASRPMLAEILARQPPWREWYLGELGTSSSEAAASLLALLRAGPTPPSLTEIRAYLNRLVRAGALTAAYLAWVQTLSSEQQLSLGLLNNGSFEQSPTEIPFDWTISRIPGAASEIGEAPGKAGKALMVDFANQRVAYRQVAQTLMLAPGRYVLSGLVKAEALDNARGLAWRISCAAKPDEAFAETIHFKGTLPWSEFRVNFEVPKEGCRGQLLRLEIATRIVLEQTIGGRIWFDDIAVRPEGAS